MFWFAPSPPVGSSWPWLTVTAAVKHREAQRYSREGVELSAYHLPVGWFRVDAEALTADAHALADTHAATTTPIALPPAPDPVSLGATAILQAHSDALATTVEHSGAQREHGGAALALGAAVLHAADAQHAGALGGSRTPAPPAVNGNGLRPPLDLEPLNVTAAIPPPGLAGEQFSELVHGGQGAGGLLDFADAWRTHGARLDHLADRVHGLGDAIDAHWTNGIQKAGANTREHAAWLRDGADQARRIASATTVLADHFTTAQQATPTPREFATARAAFALGQRLGDPVVTARALQKFTTLESTASEAAATYHGAASAATKRIGPPPQTAPPIARGGVQVLAASFKTDMDGDHDPLHHHEPEVVGPAGPPDGRDPETGAVVLPGEGQGGAGMRSGPTAPVEITGVTSHGADQIASRNGGHGVNDAAMREAVASPKQPPVFKPDEYGGTWKYQGTDATVVLNQNGEVVTAWAKTSKGWRNP